MRQVTRVDPTRLHKFTKMLLKLITHHLKIMKTRSQFP